MRIGDSATISRTFAAHDVAELAGLTGLKVGRELPGPLIGALWSTLLGCHLPGPGTLYLQQETRYLRSAALDEALTATVEIVGLRPERHLVELATRCTDSQGALLAEGTAVVYVKHLIPRD